MPEVRVDPLTGLKVIVAGVHKGTLAPPRRAGAHVDVGAAPGLVRGLPELRPALDPRSPEPDRDAVPDLFTARAASGRHEVMVNGPPPARSLAELSAAQVAAALDAWRVRMLAQEGAAYVHVTVDEGAEAGASLPHTHAQLYALDFVPAVIARERERFAAHAARTMGGNLLQDLLQEEVRRRERVVAIDDDAVVLAPYASTLPYQLMLVPRRARKRFEDDGPTGARLLHDALGRLARHLGASPPLNLWVRTAPRGADHWCWRIDILPRLTALAGLELGTGVHLNALAPEDAAAALRHA